MSTHLDPNLAQKIVHEVKFQGVFDEFRKDSIADVDTKPAYQNLRQRVENAVQKFLSEQRWTPDTNKYQLRDRLRRHITESGFLDVGVERIVDQVVNPKIGSVFQPKIEEIAYKYLGLPPPATKTEHSTQMTQPLPPLPPNPINGDVLKIETTISETENLLPRDLEQVSPDSDKTAEEEEKVDLDEEDESPPFEPITDCKSPLKIEKTESNDLKIEVKTELDEKKCVAVKEAEVKTEQLEQSKTLRVQTTTPIKDECNTVDGLASQESQLSQVSSDTTSNQLNQSVSDPPTNLENAATANISEEAQMPKFNENSTENEGNMKKDSDLHFDIKKDEIKFEGTERKTNHLEGERNEPPIIGSSDAYSAGIEAKSAFNFSKLVKVEPQDTGNSTVSSQDDTSSAQLCIVEKSEQDLLQTNDTNSLQKVLPPPEESSVTNVNSSQQQAKVNDEKRKSKSSSTSTSSRHKKSSKSSRRSPERSSHHRRDEKDRERDRDRHSKYSSSERHSDNKHTTSKYHNSSTEKHSSSSTKRDEKRSSSSRSESQSRHSSSKRDHRDKYDSKKYRSHKNHRSDKDSYKSRKSSTADDHSEFKEKVRRRKSTDSNDEDKSPPQNGGLNGTTNNNKSTAEDVATKTTPPTANGVKNNSNETSKHSKDHKYKDAMPDATLNVNNHMVIVVNEILTDPKIGFIELETKSKANTNNKCTATTTITTTNTSHDEEGELFYFDAKETDLNERLNMLDEAINRCSLTYKAFNETQKLVDALKSKANNNNNNSNNNNTELAQKMKATLQVDCYHHQYGIGDAAAVAATHNEKSSSSSSTATPTATAIDVVDDNAAFSTAKRFKFDADCGMSKENEMNEKNAIKTDVDAKKTAVSKRVDTLAKQRYTSEDLYKPRPVLGQRLKRRGLDS